MRTIEPSVTLLHATAQPERTIERAGRICYQSQHKIEPCPRCEGGPFGCAACQGTGTDISSANDFIRMILKRGHEAVIEHVSAGFLIVTDRGVTHELVRHRLSSFCMESTRYCDYSNERFGGDLSFIVPPDLDASARHEWDLAMINAEEVYQDLRGRGVAPQIARSVLPNALKSEIAMTANAREWRHFLRLRTSAAAHPQMREMAEMIGRALREWSPVLFEDVVPA